LFFFSLSLLFVALSLFFFLLLQLVPGFHFAFVDLFSSVHHLVVESLFE